MNFSKKILLLWVIFALLDPDPDSEYGSGSTDRIESGSNPDPDPQPWLIGRRLTEASQGGNVGKGIMYQKTRGTTVNRYRVPRTGCFGVGRSDEVSCEKHRIL
jgi:hypothetical protein